MRLLCFNVRKDYDSDLGYIMEVQIRLQECTDHEAELEDLESELKRMLPKWEGSKRLEK